MISKSSCPRTLILATSRAPEMRARALRPAEHPRTDYVELSMIRPCDVLDYAIYDVLGPQRALRGLERRLRLDFHLALLGYRRSRAYESVLLMSERVAMPYLALCRVFGNRARSVMISMHSSMTQARIFRALDLSSAVGGIVSFTPAQEPFLTTEMGVSPEMVSYVPYAVDTDFYSPTRAQVEQYVMAAGGIPGRDYGTFLEAVRDLGCDVRIVCGGRAYGRDTSHGLGVLHERVSVLSGLSATSMRETYARAAIVVVPLSAGRADAAGSTVLLEAMSMGKCVVVSNSPGIAHYVGRGENVALVEAGRADLMRDALSGLLDQGFERASFGSRARQMVIDECDVARYAQRLTRVIDGEILAWPAGLRGPSWRVEMSGDASRGS